MPLKTDLTLGLLSIATIFVIACKEKKSSTTSGVRIEESTVKEDIATIVNAPNNDAISTGFGYAEKNDPKALEIADSLIKFGKTNSIIANGFYMKGIYFTNLNNTDKALANFDSAIVTNYTYTDPYIEKAILLYERKKFDLALDLLNKASQLDRYNPEIYYWMAKLYESKKNHEEALFYYEQTIVLDPGYENARKAIDQLKRNTKTTDK